ncbi:MAG: 4Fe-4S dicluster domain-containing protein, partial [Gemmatimonadetes bacterium]|nr:4Fe-4S dicluster domain-containing protein [Gemmatimonadota bacterium]
AMRPIFNTRAVGDIVLGISRVLGVVPTPGFVGEGWLDYLRSAWAGRTATQAAWETALKRGGVFAGAGGGTQALGFTAQPAPGATATAAPAAGAVAATAAAPAQPVQAAPAPAAVAPATYQAPRYEGPADGLHLVVYPSSRFYDGRTANRPWLLELPDPVMKVSWDSWAELHPDTAKRLELEQGDEVAIASPHGSITTRIYVYPGVVRDTVAVQMGLGHDAFGQYTEGVGANPMKLLGATVDPSTGALLTAGVKVELRPTGRGNVTRLFPRGLVEQGVRVQHDRAIAKAISLAQLSQLDQAGRGHIPGSEKVIEQLKGAGGFVPEATTTDPAAYPPAGTEYGEYIENETRWAMVVDLARCIGCSACVVACFAENNIPMVGPTEIRKGRDLHWLRIERYFGTSRHEEEAYRDDATDDVRFLPMLCQHCGQAPCEPVCPVYAAYHTPDGLNGQVYNRCVGTRYCANNCPWKVRVFNWFTYQFAEPLNWQLNPDVTVREKGVMEKCTFCVQRIHE